MSSTTETIPDYGDDAAPDHAAVADAFDRLDRHAREAAQLEDELGALAAQAETKQTAYNQLVNRSIPELLETMKIEAVTTTSGLKVSVKRTIRAGLPSSKERPVEREQAIRWLVDNGHGGLVKNKVVVSLDRGEDGRATALVTMLREGGFDPSADKDVHAGTLSALVRELLGEGTAVPMELLQVYDQRIAVVKRR